MKLKKPNFWDYPKPNFISNILYPASKITEVLSNISFKKKFTYNNIKTICIGNIYLGGTGKTSLAIEIKRIFDENNIKSCFIKKEYNDQIDEQRLLEKFGKTFVNKSRLKALQNAVKEKYQVAIFDDGLQDKEISYDLSFVCFNQKNLLGNGRMIPAGPLRENLTKLIKYENIFLNGNNEDCEHLKNKMNLKLTNLNFYCSAYKPLNLDQFNVNEKYIVFSGIGNHDTFVDMLNKYKFNIIQEIQYPDHYEYSKNDIKKILEKSTLNSARILTTEKDYLRLDENLKKNIEFIKIRLKIQNIDGIKKKLLFLLSNENN